MLYVSRIELKNFRCFENVTIEADVNSGSAPWTLLTGDNASGKSTLLKAIALGLCDQSSAAGLLRESDSGYIRHGKDWAKIKIYLIDPEAGQCCNEYWIETRLNRLDSRLEHLEQSSKPEKFPWDRIFVCGYGAGRGTSGTGDVAGYTAISAVYNLFNYSEGLQNPELTILRMESPRQKRVLETLKSILLDLSDFRLSEDGTSTKGITVKDRRGVEVALRDLADGYKSTLLWVTDLLGWAFDSDREPDAAINGIVVIDEIEQHLHPKWQMRVISDLRSMFPYVQFFAATHSPLVARSFRPFSDDGPHRHHHLKNSETNDRVEAVEVEPLGRKRTDQILASEAFDYLIDEDPNAKLILEELSSLSGNEFLTEEQRSRVKRLQKAVDEIQSFRLGQTDIEISAAKLVESLQSYLIDELDREM